MARNKLLLLLCILPAVTGCFKIDDSRYRDMYIKSVSEVVAEKENLKAALTPVAAQPEAEQTQAPKNLTVTAGVKPAAAPQNSPTQEATAAASAPKPKMKMKVRVVEVGSDNLTFNNENKKAVFRGNVVVNTDDIKIFCRELNSENYQQTAEATGNVSVIYKKQGMKMTCKYMKYKDNLNNVTAYENVRAVKILPDGNTLTMHADEVNFDTREQSLTAYKKDKKVKIELKDLVAFSEKVVYNELDKKIYMTGEPIVRKKNSYFLSDVIVLDTLNRLFVMKNSIWSKLFYREFEETNKEIVIEDSKNVAPR